MRARGTLAAMAAMAVLAPAAAQAGPAKALDTVISGVVSEAAGGRPLGGACVLAVKFGNDEFGALGNTVTNASGRYELRIKHSPLQNEYSYVELHFDSNCGAGGYWAATTPIRMSSAPGAYQKDVALARGGRLVGRTTNAASGQALGGVRVWTMRPAVDPDWTLEQISTTTAADGSYVLGSLPSGPVTVHFSSRYHSGGGLTTSVSAGADTVGNVALSTFAGAVAGQVRLTTTGTPYPNVTVCADTGAYRTWCATTDRKGRYLLDGVHQGAGVLSLRTPAGTRHSQQMTVPGGATLTLDVAVPA